MSIVEFLLARIGEDEAAANAAAESDPSKQANYMDEGPAGSKWTATDGMVSGQSGDLWDCEGSGTLCTSPEVAEHFALHDPARVLAECAARRAIIEHAEDLRTSYTEDLNSGGTYADRIPGKDGWLYPFDASPILSALAAVYASHPDYDPDWA